MELFLAYHGYARFLLKITLFSSVIKENPESSNSRRPQYNNMQVICQEKFSKTLRYVQ